MKSRRSQDGILEHDAAFSSQKTLPQLRQTIEADGSRSTVNASARTRADGEARGYRIRRTMVMGNVTQSVRKLPTGELIAETPRPVPLQVTRWPTTLPNIMMVTCLGSAALAIGADDLDDMEPDFTSSLFSALVAASVGGFLRQRTSDRCHPTNIVEAHMALVSVFLLLGIHSVILKAYLKEANPIMVVVDELSCGAMILILYAAVSKLPLDLDRLDQLPAIVCGGFFAISQLAFTVGLKIKDPVSASLWQPGIAVFTSAFAIMSGYERSTTLKGVSFLFSACGILTCVSLDPEDGADKLAGGLANVCFLVGCYTFAAFNVMSKEVVTRYHVVTVATWTVVWAAATAAVLLLVVGVHSESVALSCWSKNPAAMATCMNDFWSPQQIPASVLLCLTVLFVSVPALLSYAIGFVKPSVVGVYTVCQPVSAMLVSMFLILFCGLEWADSHDVPLPDFETLVGTMIAGALLSLVLIQGVLGF